jgi:hypothetical protein
MSKPLGYLLNKEIIDSKTGQPPKIVNNQQFLIWKFLKNPRDISWPREIKIANKLLAQFKSIEYWNFVDLPFSLNSLAWFISSNGQEFLNQQKRKMEFIKQNPTMINQIPVELLEKPIGEDIAIDQKPKTLLDFLK